VTQVAIAFIAVVYQLVCARPFLALLVLMHRMTQELLAQAAVWMRLSVDLLTLRTLVVVRPAKSALGLLCAPLVIVTAERQAMFVS
jgi:hypothetical protein